jgi:hypothetical protein
MGRVMAGGEVIIDNGVSTVIVALSPVSASPSSSAELLSGNRDDIFFLRVLMELRLSSERIPCYSKG